MEKGNQRPRGSLLNSLFFKKYSAFIFYHFYIELCNEIYEFMRKAHSEMLNSKKFMNKTNTEMRYKSTHFYLFWYSFYAKGKKIKIGVFILYLGRGVVWSYCPVIATRNF